MTKNIKIALIVTVVAVGAYFGYKFVKKQIVIKKLTSVT
jgi:predicted negative regulator of RcsB-dependent stress response